MATRSVYVMQDQVTDRVGSIMACDIRQPDRRRSHHPGPLMLPAAVAVLYILALAMAS